MGCGSSSNSHAHVKVKEDFHDQYSLGEELGKGAFGAVFLARLRNQDDPNCDTWYAAKAINRKGPHGPAQIWKEFNFEISMLSHVKSSPNVVQLIDAFKDGQFFYIIMECCGSTVLDAFKEKHDAHEHDLAHVFGEMIAGIAHCHSLRVVHRDVKPQNYLLSRGARLGDENCVIKLCDFGGAAEVKSKGLNERMGTIQYMAPEMLAMQKPYDYKVDVWSFGVTVYLMLFGSFPYKPDEAHKDTEGIDFSSMHALVEGNVKPSYEAQEGLEQPSSHACEFVQALLERDAHQRPTAAQVVQMPYLQDCSNCDDDGSSPPKPMSPTKEFFRTHSRLRSLHSNLSKASEKDKEVQAERAISSEAFKSLTKEELKNKA